MRLASERLLSLWRFFYAHRMFSRVPLASSLLLAALMAVASARAADPLWRDIDEAALKSAAARSGAVEARRNIVPQSYRTLELNRRALERVLAAAPAEFSVPLEVASAELTLPLPDGGFGRFQLQESPLMEPALAKRFPEIKTYVGQGIDDPTANVRIDVTPAGFHAIILSASGQVYVDPYWRDSDVTYVAYRKSEYAADKPFSCLLKPNPDAPQRPAADADAVARPTGANLRTYRLAVACTGEYATAVSSPNAPSVARALGAIITTVNRVSAIYEREFAIRLTLIANNDKLIYLNGSTDPYSNEDGSAMLTQNQSNIDSVIGSANYDIGHVFSTGGGGVAYLGVPCLNARKAGGVTGQSKPTGDPFDVDYVAHEMGHQFGGNHTFNSSVGSCGGGNRNASTAFEVGSGTSIMAYAGICGATDIAPNSDEYFHTGSYTEIDNFSSGSTGGSCAASTPTGNTAPVIDALPTGYTIPANTPFALTGSATDANGDTLTYSWEEYDLGAAQSTQNPSSSSTGPIFRSYSPTLSPTRFFPSLTYVLNHANVPPATVNGYASGEVLPTIARTMTFRLTVRDNRAGGGGSNWASTAVSTVATGAAFAVTSQNAAVTYAGGSQQTVTWDVAGTTGNGINTANVKISLSTDGGKTFPTVLAATVPNSGTATVTLPQIATVQGRIKVEAVGNIFFDISNANFTITSSNGAPTVNVTNSLTLVRGTSTAASGVIGTAADANGDAMSVSVSDLPYGANVSASLVGNNISLAGTADCALVTTLSTRTYPITITVTDAYGASRSATVNLLIAPNPSPTLGAYPTTSVARSHSVNITPSSVAADANNNLVPSPYSVTPATLPGGGTISVNQNTGVVTVTAVAGSTLGITTVRVTALDSCGAAAVSMFDVNVAASNAPALAAGSASAPTNESCAPANGAVDPGETVTVNLPIANTGAAPTNNLTATLQNGGGVTPITTTQNYGAIAANATATRAFQFTAGGACGNTVTATLQLQDGAAIYSSISYTIRLGAPASSASALQHFDGVTAPALPPGWSAVVTGGMSPWTTSNTSPDTGPNSAAATTVGTVSDNSLTSPAVSIASSSIQLWFRHRWNLETGYDGGRLEISVNGGAFTEIVAAGGSFASGGYNGSLSASYGNPIGGSNAWTGSANAAYTTTLVNLPPQAAGQNVQFRWRLATDNDYSVPGAVWRIDTVNLITNGFVCSDCTAAPQFTSAPPSPATVGTPYSHTFMTTGSPTATYTLTSGTLPPGLTLSASGVLSGTPTSAGNGSFPNIVVTAANSAGSAQQTFSLTVATSSANYIASFGLGGADAAYNADPERDGIPNGLEYALQLNPAVSGMAGLPLTALKDYAGTRYLSMTFTRSSVAIDISYIVEATSNLADPNSWVTLGSSASGGPMTGAGVMSDAGPAPNFNVEVRDTTPANAASPTPRFMRLRITSP
jgi:hypothetical protein